MAAARSRSGWVFFVGIAAMALLTVSALVTRPGLPTAIIIAAAAVDAVTAAAGTLIYRAGELARRPPGAPARAGETPSPPPRRNGEHTRAPSAEPGPGGASRIRISHFHGGTLTVSGNPAGASSGPPPARRPRAAPAGLLALVLVLALAAAAAVGAAGTLTHGHLTAYQVTLIASAAPLITLTALRCLRTAPRWLPAALRWLPAKRRQRRARRP
jgi:hypothetical protein